MRRTYMVCLDDVTYDNLYIFFYGLVINNLNIYTLEGGHYIHSKRA